MYFLSEHNIIFILVEKENIFFGFADQSLKLGINSMKAPICMYEYPYICQFFLQIFLTDNNKNRKISLHVFERNDGFQMHFD